MVQWKSSTALKSLFWPITLAFLMVIVFISEQLHLYNQIILGIYPRNVKYLYGIITAPFSHGDVSHILGNLFAFIPLSFFLFYLYKKDAGKILTVLWLLTGFLVWIFGRSVIHIGASGLVYGLQGFLLISGFLKWRADMMAIAALCIILFGTGFYFGMLPFQEGVSWESHLMGFIAGIILSFVFINDGPARKRKILQSLEEDEYAQFDSK